MKKNLFKLLLVIILYLFYNNLVFSQTSCDCKTPFPNWCLNASCDSKQLMVAIDNTYLCHDFVRMYYEGICEKPSYTHPYTPASCSWTDSNVQNQNIKYFDLPTYVQVASESTGNIARYIVKSPNNESIIDHSQVKDALKTSKYISKYNNDGPLVAHDLNKSWYKFINPNGTFKYYFYIGPITGEANPTNPNPFTYSVNGNTSFITYLWTVSNSSVILTSATNQNTVQLMALQSGEVDLKVETKDKSNSLPGKSQILHLNIILPTLINGVYDNAGRYNQLLCTANRVSVGNVIVRVSVPNSASISWQKTGGNINGYFIDGTSASFSMTSKGSITLLITSVYNGSTYTKSVTFYNS
jgi:hypothetical protein